MAAQAALALSPCLYPCFVTHHLAALRTASAGALALTTRYEFALFSDPARIVARGNVLRGTSK
ncbi:MAG TPA: hypothetical protein DIW40_10735 [Halomonas sp.]|nr:hypothetical protein [Halomonas sp.]